MSTELLPYNQTETNIIENAEKFSKYLSSEAVNPIRPSLTIIPNALKDILNYLIERRVLKEEDKKFDTKTKLANKSLELQERNSRRKYNLEINKVQEEAGIAIREIEQQEIIALKKIKSEERTELAKINTDYNLARIQQDNEMKMFLKGLKESGRRFDKCMQEKIKFQEELSQIISLITNKMVKGRVSKEEYTILNQAITMKKEALANQFDMSEILVKIFGEGL